MFKAFTNAPRVFRNFQCYKKSKRSYLSDAYKCNEAWENRLKAPIFQKTDYDDLYYQLDRSITIGYKISVLDVDIFVNGVKDELHVGELGDILFKIRLNPETGIVHNSTQHAAIRFHLALGKKQQLLDILSDRLNYGIFPDYYLSNLMMDMFLKEEDFVAAARIASLQMLQEDFGHPITKALSLHSCLKYLNSTQIWASPVEAEVDSDEEETRIRVPFVRNPYFDDHFDIEDTNHLVGKTLLLSGQEVKNPLGTSSQILGLALYEKHKDNTIFLNSLAKGKGKIYKEVVEKVKEYLEKKPKQPEGEKPADSEEVARSKGEVLQALGNVETSCELLEESLETISGDLVTSAVAEHQQADITRQCQVYAEWEKEREEAIQEEMQEDKKRQIQEEIEKTKEDLSKEEKVLFFFENEEKLDLIIEGKEEEKKNIRYYKERRKSAKDDTYIPPHVGQRNN